MIYRRNHTKEEIVKMVKAGEITYAGTFSTKLYGEIGGRNLLSGKGCGGATVLKRNAEKDQSKSTQVFFTNEIDALENGYKPCSNCLTHLANEREAAPDKKAWTQNRINLLKKG